MHAQFHERVVGAITKEGTDLSVLHIPLDLLQSYVKSIADEVEINRESWADPLNRQLDALDAERDKILSYFFAAVKNARISPIAAQANAAMALELPVKEYYRIQNEANEVETLHIKGLAHDMRKAVNYAHITTLSLTETLQQLENKNEEYITLKEKRTEKHIARQLESSKVVRPHTDGLYYEIVNLINASYLLTKDGTDRFMIEMLIDRINDYIAEFKTTAKQMGSKPAAAGEE